MTLQPPQVQTYQPLVQNELDLDTPPHMAPANVRREVESQNDGPPGTGEPPWAPLGPQAPRAAAVTPRGGAALLGLPVPTTPAPRQLQQQPPPPPPAEVQIGQDGDPIVGLALFACEDNTTAAYNKEYLATAIDFLPPAIRGEMNLTEVTGFIEENLMGRRSTWKILKGKIERVCVRFNSGPLYDLKVLRGVYMSTGALLGHVTRRGRAIGLPAAPCPSAPTDMVTVWLAFAERRFSPDRRGSPTSATLRFPRRLGRILPLRRGSRMPLVSFRAVKQLNLSAS